MSKSSKSVPLHCIACKKVIRGKPRIMMLQITSSEPRFIEKAKKLGFTSNNWQSGGSIREIFTKTVSTKQS
ncbi:MAG TPA: hypothetical protein VN949_03075 [Candidatus Limnocylindrales bacterium]|nr:hypothetical protein [Candidatus Limnocylindrales bacterium]